MRTRKEIEYERTHEEQGYFRERVKMELLLDIRDLLIKILAK